MIRAVKQFRASSDSAPETALRRRRCTSIGMNSRSSLEKPGNPQHAALGDLRSLLGAVVQKPGGDAHGIAVDDPALAKAKRHALLKGGPFDHFPLPSPSQVCATGVHGIDRIVYNLIALSPEAGPFAPRVPNRFGIQIFQFFHVRFMFVHVPPPRSPPCSVDVRPRKYTAQCNTTMVFLFV